MPHYCDYFDETFQRPLVNLGEGILLSASVLASAVQPFEFTKVFSFCRNWAAVNQNNNDKVFPTIFFMLKRKNKVRESILNK